MGEKKDPTPVMLISTWIKKQSRKTKIAIGISFVIAVACLVALQSTRSYQYYTFIFGGGANVAGICVLIYKLHSKKSCSGLSLKSQELTAVYLAVRMYCTYTLQIDLHTWFDFAKLSSTLWVIYMIRFKLKSTYDKDLDTLPLYYVIIPAAILSLIIHPYYSGFSFEAIPAILWAFCVYMDAVAVLPQLLLMQNAKMAEPFTAHYVFALGITRFLGFAYWIIMIIETRGRFLRFWGYGSLWMLMNLIAELIQTFILADFVYYYVKRVMAGQLLVLP